MRKATKTVAMWFGIAAGLAGLDILTMLPLSVYTAYAHDVAEC